MGAFAFFFGKYEDAYKLLLSANQYCVTGTHPWDYVSKVKLLFSAILVFKNEFNDAKRILDFMLDKQIDNETKILIHYLYAELYERNKDFTQSRNFFNLANQMNDQFKIMDKNVKIIDISRSIGHGLLPRMYPIVEESKVIENENENTNKNKELLQEIFNAERLLDQKRYSECIEFLMPLLKKYSIGELKSDEKERYLKLYLYAGHSYKEIYYSSLNINYLRQSLLYYKKGLALLISLKKEINNLVQLRVEFLFNLGFHCCPIYGLETALKFFERALYIVSSSNTFQDKKFYMFRIHGSKGKVFLDSLKYNEAIESLTMALEFKDDSILEIKNYLPLIYRELGIAYFETNNLKKAKEDFLEAASRFQAIGMIDRVHSVEIYLDQLNNIP